MSDLLENPVTMDELYAWYKAKAELKRAQNIETMLRPRIFKHYFPDAKEGTNTSAPIDATGYVLKGQRIINREVDMGAVHAFSAAGPNGEPSKFAQMKINIDNLLRTKYELKVGDYRKCTAEEIQVIDQCLTIKDGMPQLDMVLPKRAAS